MMFCPNHAPNRRGLYEKAGTHRYQETLSTGEGPRAVARWVVNQGLLGQFSRARAQMDQGERRIIEGKAAEEVVDEIGVPGTD